MSSRRASDVPAATTTVPRSARSLKAARRTVPPGYDPGALRRKERKVLDAGARVEVRVERLLNTRRLNTVCWRRPGVKAQRLSGIDYLPDLAGYAPELRELVPDQTPQVARRPVYNFLIEVKGQHKTGSAEKKIGQAIVDMAHLCDTSRTVGAFILDTPILTDRQILDFKELGRLHSVVVVTTAEVSAGLLIPELIRVAKERRRLRRRVTQRGKYTATSRPPVYERGFAARVTQRQMMAKRMRRYSAGDLLR